MTISEGVPVLRITIIPTPYPGMESNNDALVLEISEPAGLNEDRLRDDLIAMTGLTDGFIFEERRRWAEWGASGIGYEIALTVMDTAWQGIVGGAAWAFLQASGRRLRRRYPRRWLGRTAAERITDEDAQRDARYSVVMRYDGVNADDLTVLETSTARTKGRQEYTVRMRAASGEEYVVTSSATGDASMTRIERTPD